MLLTDVKVRNARAADGKRIELSDGNGLTLRVSSDGRKAWSVIYRIAGGGPYDPTIGRNRAGSKKRVNLGYWPEVTLGQARADASALRARAMSGIDPHPSDDSAPTTVSGLIGTYCDNQKIKSVMDKRRLLEARVEPQWGDRQIETLGRSELVTLLRPLTPSRQFEVRKHVVAMFNWAADQGIIATNPFGGMRLKIQMKPRDRALTLTEAKAVYSKSDMMAYPFGSLYQLLLLTGCRLREISDAQWSWLSGDEMIIPGEKRKTGKPHIVPITAASAALLASIPRQTGPHIFSTTDGQRPISGFSKAKARLDELLGPNFEAFVVHDFRRTVRSQLSRLGVDAVTAELVLGHQLSGIVGVYDRYERLAERRNALQWWTDALLG